jgi:hypothetical protein
VYKTLAGNPEIKRPLGRAKHRWEDVIRMGLGEIGGAVGCVFIWLRIVSSGRLM